MVRGALDSITFQEHALLLGVTSCPDDTERVLGQVVIERGSGQVTELRAPVKETCCLAAFLTVPPQSCPRPSFLPLQSWDTQTWLGRFLPSGVLHSTLKGASSTVSSKVPILEPTCHGEQRETC